MSNACLLYFRAPFDSKAREVAPRCGSLIYSSAERQPISILFKIHVTSWDQTWYFIYTLTYTPLDHWGALNCYLIQVIASDLKIEVDKNRSV
jgi:hypothetical protein